MSAPTEAIDTKAEESVPELEMDAKEAAPEVVEVLVDVPNHQRCQDQN